MTLYWRDIHQWKHKKRYEDFYLGNWECKGFFSREQVIYLLHEGDITNKRAQELLQLDYEVIKDKLKGL